MDSVWESAEDDRDGDLAGGIDRLGSLIPDGKKDCIKIRKSICAWKRAWYFQGWHLDLPVYHAGKRERDYGLLQCLAAQIRGDVAVGAMTILSSAMQFSMLPMQGLGQGAQPITSYNYGARNADRVKKTFRLLLTTSLCYSMAVWLLIMLFPQVFAMIFLPTQS